MTSSLFMPADAQLKDVWDMLCEPAPKRSRSQEGSGSRAETPAQPTASAAPPSNKRAASRARNVGGEQGKADPLIRNLARLVLQQQEALQAHGRACGYLLHLGRSESLAIVPQLVQTSKAWKEAMEKASQSIREPLRVLLFKVVMGTLMMRMAELQKAMKDKKNPLVQLCLNDSERLYSVEWDQATETLKQVIGGPELTLEAFAKLMEEMSAHVCAEGIERLKILRPLTTLSPTNTLPGLQCYLTSRQASLGNYAPIDQSHLLEACGRLSSCGEWQDATPRGSDQASALSQRLPGREEGPSVRLSNPNGTSCYLNALAFAIWWLWHLHALSVPALPQAIRNAISVGRRSLGSYYSY